MRQNKRSIPPRPAIAINHNNVLKKASWCGPPVVATGKMHQQLFTLYEKAEKIAATLDGILEVQRASRPDLPIPDDHPGRNGVLGEFYSFIKQIKKERDASLSPNELIAEQWRKEAYFADQHLISHKQFLTGVSSLLSGETFEYVRKLPKDTPLETVA